jgi:hypothetical protein
MFTVEVHVHSHLLIELMARDASLPSMEELHTFPISQDFNELDIANRVNQTNKPRTYCNHHAREYIV